MTRNLFVFKQIPQLQKPQLRNDRLVDWLRLALFAKFTERFY